MAPAHGFTRAGQPVHARVIDHHPAGTRYQRLNKRVATWITAKVFTMSCFWGFCLLALLSLPATLVAAHFVHVGLLPAALADAGLILVVQWVAQSFLQLVLLPSIGVGQNLQNIASDARAAKTFEDVERVLDALSLETEGGLKAVRDDILAALGSSARP